MQITEISGMTQSMPPIVDSQVSVFESHQFGKIRIVKGNNGEPWFVAKDVCEALGLDNVSQAVSSLEDDEKAYIEANIINNDVQGGRHPLIISEPGLYSLVIRSTKQEAKTFKRWITHDVLPTIRKHGFYGTPRTIEAMIEDPDTAIRLLLTVKEERQKRLALEAQAAIDRPKVVFADSIEVSKTSILVGELAKLIKQSTGVDVGQNRMFEFLRENGYIHKFGSQKNMPTQRSVEAGWMEIKEGTRIGSSGESHITKTTKITGKGQIYFVNLFKKMAAN